MSCVTVVVWPWTLAFLRCRDGARRVLTTRQTLLTCAVRSWTSRMKRHLHRSKNPLWGVFFCIEPETIFFQTPHATTHPTCVDRRGGRGEGQSHHTRVKSPDRLLQCPPPKPHRLTKQITRNKRETPWTRCCGVIFFLTFGKVDRPTMRTNVGSAVGVMTVGLP